MEPNVECASCGKPLYRCQRKVEHFKKHYCNERCQSDEKFRWLAYIWPNRETSRPTQMAKHIGIPHPTMRTWLFHINKELPEHLKLRFKKGKIGVGRKKKPPKERKKKEVKPPPPPKAKPVKPVVIKNNSPRYQEVKNPVLAPRPFNPSEYQMIRVDHKTWKQVPKSY